MKDAPIGFLMELSKDEKALSRYARLSREEKQKVLEKASRVSSRREMQSMVSAIGTEQTQI